VERERNKQLQDEIKMLQTQLKQTKDGLTAATRISEQLSKKSDMITSLKLEVQLKQEELDSVKEKLKNINTTHEGKVDRTLVKNLVVGLIASPTSQRQEVIRIIATVLDFNGDDRKKTGLEGGSNIPKGTWLASLNSLLSSSSPGGDASTHDQSFMKEFVKFLEVESTTRPSLPLLPVPTQPKSRRPSSTSSDGSSHQRQLSIDENDVPSSLAMNTSAALPTLAPLPKSSSTLRNILK